MHTFHGKTVDFTFNSDFSGHIKITENNEEVSVAGDDLLSLFKKYFFNPDTMEATFRQEKDRIYLVVNANGLSFEKDFTDYFSNDNAHDDWLDYKIGLKYS